MKSLVNRRHMCLSIVDKPANFLACWYLWRAGGGGGSKPLFCSETDNKFSTTPVAATEAAAAEAAADDHLPFLDDRFALCSRYDTNYGSMTKAQQELPVVLDGERSCNQELDFALLQEQEIGFEISHKANSRAKAYLRMAA